MPSPYFFLSDAEFDFIRKDTLGLSTERVVRGLDIVVLEDGGDVRGDDASRSAHDDAGLLTVGHGHGARTRTTALWGRQRRPPILRTTWQPRAPLPVAHVSKICMVLRSTEF